MEPITITRDEHGNARVRQGGREWLIGARWSEGTNPSALIADLWFYGASELPAHWTENEIQAIDLS